MTRGVASARRRRSARLSSLLSSLVSSLVPPLLPTLAVLAVAVLVTVLSAGPASARPTPAGGAEPLGGYAVRASASPVAVLLYEPVIPTTTEPQLELDAAYSRASMDTGPTTSALASTLWPGDTIGQGFGQLTGQEGRRYPLVARARYPGGPKGQTREPAPASSMQTTAHQRRAEAVSRAAALPSELAPLVSARAAASSSVAERAEGSASVTARARAYAGDMALLGGLLRVETVRVEAVATSGSRVATSGDTALSGVSMFGRSVRVGPDGVARGSAIGGGPPIPERPADGLNEVLESAGISIAATPADRRVDGATASRRTRALVVSIDTGPLRRALEGTTSPLAAALPDDVRAQLAPALRLAPRIEIRVGDASAAASSAPATGAGPLGGPPVQPPGSGGIPGEALGPAGAQPASPGLRPGGGGASGAAGRVDLPMVAGEGRRPYAFGGIPAVLVVCVVAASAGVAWGLRYAAAWLLGGGAAACDLGHGRRVPNLRKEGT